MSARRSILAALLPALIALPIAAQDVVVFPEEAMDDLMRVTMAQTADQKCDGISARSMRVQVAMVTMLTHVKELGYDPVAAVEYLNTEEASARIAVREVALREKHGVDAESDEGLCAAIRAEAAEDEDLADLVRIN